MIYRYLYRLLLLGFVCLCSVKSSWGQNWPLIINDLNETGFNLYNKEGLTYKYTFRLRGGAEFTRMLRPGASEYYNLSPTQVVIDGARLEVSYDAECFRADQELMTKAINDKIMDAAWRGGFLALLDRFAEDKKGFWLADLWTEGRKIYIAKEQFEGLAEAYKTNGGRGVAEYYGEILKDEMIGQGIEQTAEVLSRYGIDEYLTIALGNAMYEAKNVDLSRFEKLHMLQLSMLKTQYRATALISYQDHIAPYLDRDLDGVFNSADQCPDEAGKKKHKGCPWKSIRKQRNSTLKRFIVSAGIGHASWQHAELTEAARQPFERWSFLLRGEWMLFRHIFDAKRYGAFGLIYTADFGRITAGGQPLMESQDKPKKSYDPELRMQVGLSYKYLKSVNGVGLFVQPMAGLNFIGKDFSEGWKHKYYFGGLQAGVEVAYITMSCGLQYRLLPPSKTPYPSFPTLQTPRRDLAFSLMFGLKLF